MRNKVEYEWCYETIDEHGDILDNDFEETLAAFDDSRKTDDLCLVRNEGNDEDGLVERLWAYVKDGKLPETFSDSMGTPIGIDVPKRFLAEFEKHSSKQPDNQ